MTLRDHEAIEIRYVNERRRHIAVAADASGRYVDNRALRLADCGIAYSSAANATISGGRIRRLMTNRRFRETFLRLATRDQMDTGRRLLSYLALDMRDATCLHTARETIIRRSTMVTYREGALDSALISGEIQRLDRAMGIDLTDAMIAAFSDVVRRTMGEITIILVILNDVCAALNHSEIYTA